MPLVQVAEIGTGLKAFWRGDAEYEDTRRKMWNCRVPGRYPDVIVQPETEDEVIAAVRLARSRGFRIAIRSGGHSWAANFLRDGGMLIDCSNLTGFSVDLENRT